MYMAKTNYLSNAELRKSIWLSKLSYCSIRKLNNAVIEEPDIRVDSIADIDYDKLPLGETMVMTHYTDYLLPTDEALPFAAFQIWSIFKDTDGERIVEVSRSFWKNGEFKPDGGRLTETMGQQILLIVKKYSQKANWAGYSYKDEMCERAIMMLVQNVLKFDRRKTDNAFAFMTTNIYYAFVRIKQMEDRHNRYRQSELEAAMGYK